jgi:hypothetical protein
MFRIRVYFGQVRPDPIRIETEIGATTLNRNKTFDRVEGQFAVSDSLFTSTSRE